LPYGARLTEAVPTRFDLGCGAPSRCIASKRHAPTCCEMPTALCGRHDFQTDAPPGGTASRIQRSSAEAATTPGEPADGVEE